MKPNKLNIMNPKQNLINLLQDKIQHLYDEIDKQFEKINSEYPYCTNFPFNKQIEHLSSCIDYCCKLIDCLSKDNTNQNCKISNTIQK